MADDVHDIAADRLKAVDQRYTSGRRALVDVLAAADDPLTMAAILERDRSLAQSSAYRNLAMLEQAGVVHRVASSDEFARYELAEQLTRHHHHLICSACGLVRDFTISDELEAQLEKALRRVARRNEFDADHHRLDLVGLCDGCR
ncbi:MAG: Fur family transcriptional regulator [Acidimicrobiia bacterium]